MDRYLARSEFSLERRRVGPFTEGSSRQATSSDLEVLLELQFSAPAAAATTGAISIRTNDHSEVRCHESVIRPASLVEGRFQVPTGGAQGLRG